MQNYVIELKYRKNFLERMSYWYNELRVYQQEQIGIVGRNGAGKIILSKLITEEIKPEM